MPITTAADYSLSQPAGLSARNAAVVTPNDSADLAQVTRAILVGVGGTVTVNMAGTGTQVAMIVPTGGFLPVSVSRIYATGTDATDIVAFW